MLRHPFALSVRVPPAISISKNDYILVSANPRQHGSVGVSATGFHTLLEYIPMDACLDLLHCWGR